MPGSFCTQCKGMTTAHIIVGLILLPNRCTKSICILRWLNLPRVRFGSTESSIARFHMLMECSTRYICTRHIFTPKQRTHKFLCMPVHAIKVVNGCLAVQLLSYDLYVAGRSPHRSGMDACAANIDCDRTMTAMLAFLCLAIAWVLSQSGTCIRLLMLGHSGSHQCLL